MLVELAAANAAFAIIKKTVQNTGDLARVANQMAEFVGAKTELEQRVKKKKNSLFSDPEAVNDMEEFLALESIRKNEEELKEFMIWSGRANLWNDWVKFQAQARKKRIAEEAARAKMISTIMFRVGLGLVALTLVGGIIGLIFFASFLQGL
jgi:hypothetical protein